MALGLFIFLIAIAKATFIESDYGTPAAKIAIYNTIWFELLLIYLSFSLIVNIFKYRMFRKEKVAILSFHLAFLVIIVGAGLTRYVGYEGQMPVKEGETTNVIFSAEPYFVLKSNDMVNQFSYEEQRWLSEGRENPFQVRFQLPEKKEVEVEYVSYIENLVDTVITADSIDNMALEFVIRGKTEYLMEDTQREIGGLNFSFEKEDAVPGVRIWQNKGQLYIQSIKPFQRVDMMSLSVEDRMKNRLDSNKVNNIPADTAVPFYSGQLYMIGEESLMFREFKRNTDRIRMKAKKRNEGMNYLTVLLKSGGQTKFVEIPAKSDRIIDPVYTQFAGMNFEIGYGAKPMELPFSILCRDFQLDKYPGSEMPSSFASEVTVVDERNNKTLNKRIFMNNVMDYQGYRFFQSSYFPDESGTILSVNYDWWGTNVTYLGYLLLAVGMVLTVIAPVGRFRQLNQMINKSRKNRSKMIQTVIAIAFFGLVGSTSAFAHQDHKDTLHHHDHADQQPNTGRRAASSPKFKIPEIELKYITKEQADEISDLLVQDFDGRFVPLHTLADKILRKVYHDDTYEDKNAVQVVMAFHLYGPRKWNDKEIIFVSNKIRDQIGTGKYTSVEALEDEQGRFRLMDDYRIAFEKPDSKKSEYDKQLIKLGERYRIMKDVFAYEYLKIVPLPDIEKGNWDFPKSPRLTDIDLASNNFAYYFLLNLFYVSQDSLEYSEAEKFLEPLKEIQWNWIRDYKKLYPESDLPTKSKVEAEILYNEFKIFDNIKNIYFLLGFALLILFFIRTLAAPKRKTEKLLKRISIPFAAVIIIVFVGHGIGLGIRWYISGHAPWSNGYEAVVFIAWSTLLAGLFFIKKNPAVLAVTALLAGMMLFVTELNLLDPEITPLQPVLKSYWLMIHVAVITSSYGFLGVSAILGVLNLFLYLFLGKGNKKRLKMNINELTGVSEMSMIIGLFMLTIGTFLGGVWANESWGRYWGWDPKETWALVSVLTYAIILHLRFIPGLNGKFLFNTVSLWGFSAILFTFFGVNFKLVGLHSYAQGEGVAETPTWVYVTIGIFAAFTLASAIKYRLTERK